MTTSPLPPTTSLPPPPKPPGIWDDKANRVVLIGLGLGIVLFVASCAGLATMGQVTKTTTSTTTTYTVPTYATPNAPTVPPSTAGPTTTTTKVPDHVPTPADFTLEVIETRRACFGTAGCNVSYQVVPTYTGPALNPSKSYTVLYQVHGGEDVASDSFKMKGNGDATVPSSRSASADQGSTLTATVTRVLG